MPRRAVHDDGVQPPKRVEEIARTADVARDHGICVSPAGVTTRIAVLLTEAPAIFPASLSSRRGRA
jgi:hypothetical protein